jgi:AcrR family transcriptional regulator
VDPTDPRAVRTRAKILEATCSAIVDAGIGAITMDEVARRAGVSRSTLYRHWSELPTLVSATIEHMTIAPDTPSIADPLARLQSIIEGLGAALRKEPWATLLLAVAEGGARDDQIQQLHVEFTRARRRPALLAVAAAQRSGSLPSELDAEWIVDTLAGPLFYRRMIVHKAMTAAEVTIHVDRVLQLLTRREARPSPPRSLRGPPRRPSS